MSLEYLGKFFWSIIGIREGVPGMPMDFNQVRAKSASFNYEIHLNSMSKMIFKCLNEICSQNFV